MESEPNDEFDVKSNSTMRQKRMVMLDPRLMIEASVENPGMTSPRSGQSSNLGQQDSMSIFNETELAKTLESLYNDPNALAGQFKMPFKYKTLTYVKKILACQEVEEDAKEFRLRAPRYKTMLYTE